MVLTICFVTSVLVASCVGSGSTNNSATSPTPSSTSSEKNRSPEPTPTAATSEKGQPIHITAPGDNEQVVERPIIEGTVSDTSAKVWVIVHPIEVSDYWVQPPVTMREGGTWKVQIHIGRPGTVDVGKHFEIVAVANPKNGLKEGDKLKGWPEAKWKSQVIEVARK